MNRCEYFDLTYMFNGEIVTSYEFYRRNKEELQEVKRERRTRENAYDKKKDRG